MGAQRRATAESELAEAKGVVTVASACASAAEGELAKAEHTMKALEARNVAAENDLAEAVALISDRAAAAESELALARISSAEAEAAQRAASNEITRLQEADLCCVCQDAARSILLWPCCHMVLCAMCAGCVDSCPICRARVERRCRVLRS